MPICLDKRVPEILKLLHFILCEVELQILENLLMFYFPIKTLQNLIPIFVVVQQVKERQFRLQIPILTAAVTFSNFFAFLDFIRHNTIRITQTILLLTPINQQGQLINWPISQVLFSPADRPSEETAALIDIIGREFANSTSNYVVEGIC